MPHRSRDGRKEHQKVGAIGDGPGGSGGRVRRLGRQEWVVEDA
jgi:hypothetical protein